MDEFKTMIAGLISRHMMTGVAGALVALGAVAPDQQDQFITIGSGIIVWCIGAGWSWYKNSGQAKIAALLRKVTNRKSTAGAVEIARVVPAGSAVTPGLPARSM